MAKQIAFELISPEKIVSRENAVMVVLPGIKGELGVFPEHTFLTTYLKPGVIRLYKDNSTTLKWFVEEGCVDITPESCKILTKEAIPLDGLDKTLLEIEIKKLVEEVAASQTEEEKKRASLSLEIARVKLMELLYQDKIK